MSLLDQLIDQAGTYIGLSHDPTGEHDQPQGQIARIVITPLPNRSGVTVDYEGYDAGHTDRLQAHIEHAVIGRLEGGGSILVSGHAHAGTVAVLREASDGEFVMGDEPGAFPMAISISIPEPGRMVYVWSYGRPGEEPVARDRAEVTKY